jgi:hypothetical protein
VGLVPMAVSAAATPAWTANTAVAASTVTTAAIAAAALRRG